MYVGDCASTYRSNMFRDYEKHPYGTFEGNGQQQQQQRKSYYTMVQGKYQIPTDAFNWTKNKLLSIQLSVRTIILLPMFSEQKQNAQIKNATTFAM